MTRYSAIALVLLAAGSANAAEKKFDRTFTVTPGGALIVDADSASVQVSGVDTNQVTVHVSMRGSDEEIAAMTLDAVQKDNGVTVTAKRKDKKGGWFNWGSWSNEGNIEVTVPKRFEVSVRTGGGGIEIRDVTGAAKLNTSGGDVKARSVNGNLSVRTSGGEIEVDTVRGDVDANTSGGDLRLLHVDGQIRGHTSGGGVRCSLVGSNRGINVSTSGGDIEITVPRGTTGNVEATTSGGDVSSDLPLSTTSQKEGRLAGSLNGGGQPIDAHTSGGSIRLTAGS
ncbi:MAG: DUF4097 family beta strand repeat-containing protein [Pseudomonadota bacterium]